MRDLKRLQESRLKIIDFVSASIAHPSQLKSFRSTKNQRNEMDKNLKSIIQFYEAKQFQLCELVKLMQGMYSKNNLAQPIQNYKKVKHKVPPKKQIVFINGQWTKLPHSQLQRITMAQLNQKVQKFNKIGVFSFLRQENQFFDNYFLNIKNYVSSRIKDYQKADLDKFQKQKIQMNKISEKYFLEEVNYNKFYNQMNQLGYSQKRNHQRDKIFFDSLINKISQIDIQNKIQRMEDVEHSYFYDDQDIFGANVNHTVQQFQIGSSFLSINQNNLQPLIEQEIIILQDQDFTKEQKSAKASRPNLPANEYKQRLEQQVQFQQLGGKLQTLLNMTQPVSNLESQNFKQMKQAQDKAQHRENAQTIQNMELKKPHIQFDQVQQARESTKEFKILQQDSQQNTGVIKNLSFQNSDSKITNTGNQGIASAEKLKQSRVFDIGSKEEQENKKSSSLTIPLLRNKSPQEKNMFVTPPNNTNQSGFLNTTPLQQKSADQTFSFTKKNEEKNNAQKSDSGIKSVFSQLNRKNIQSPLSKLNLSNFESISSTAEKEQNDSNTKTNIFKSTIKNMNQSKGQLFGKAKQQNDKQIYSDWAKGGTDSLSQIKGQNPMRKWSSLTNNKQGNNVWGEFLNKKKENSIASNSTDCNDKLCSVICFQGT